VKTAPGYPALVSEYRVRATRYSRGWEFYISNASGEVGVTCARSLGDADHMVRDYLASVYDLTDEQADALQLAVVPELDADTARRLVEAKRLAAEAEAARDAAAAGARDVVARLDDEGFTGREIALIFGVSAQRVSQLLAG
jgi:DNA-directed RNA polymerase specialized sigma24 family protein